MRREGQGMLRKVTVSLAALLVVPVLSAGVLAAEEEVRTWTDSTGQYRVRAALVELKDGRA